jgi:hypothetical protein
LSQWLIATIGVVYLFVSASLFFEGKAGLAIAFLGYSIGNVGLFLAAK